jgi:hypothetical protein
VRAATPGSYARRNGAPASSVDFGRIFPSLPPFADATEPSAATLLEVGKPGGIMNCLQIAAPQHASITSAAPPMEGAAYGRWGARHRLHQETQRATHWQAGGAADEVIVTGRDAGAD